jgi:hypothetical protein
MHLTPSGPAQAPKSATVFTLFAALLILAIWGTSVFRGFFAYDDFEILSAAREYSLAEQLFLPHGDHAIPLYRMFVAAFRSAFGTETFFYNSFAFLTLLGIAVTTQRLMLRMGCDPVAPYAFLFIFFGWYALGNLITGYYVHNTYLLIILFGNLALLGLLGWQDARSRSALFLSIAAIILGLGMGLAGAIILPVVICFIVLHALLRHQGVPPVKTFALTYRGYLAAYTAIVILYAVYLFLVFIVFHDGAFLRMRGEHESTILAPLGHDFFNNLARGHVGGLPGFNLLASQSSPLGPLIYNVLAFSAFLAFVLLALSRTSVATRLFIGFLLLVICGSVVFSALGRPGSYASKHISFSFYYFSILVAITATSLFQIFRKPRIQALLVVLFCATFAIQPAISFALRGGDPRVDHARSTRQAIQEIDHAFASLATQLEPDAAIPTLDGNYIFHRFPTLYKYDLSHYLDFLSIPASYRLLRNPSMSYWHARNLNTVPQLRDHVTSGFLDSLGSDPEIRRLYLTPILLSDRSSGRAMLPAEAREIAFDIAYHDGVWRLPLLGRPIEVTIKLATTLNQVEIKVSFPNDFDQTKPLGRMWVRTAEADGEHLSLDAEPSLAIINENGSATVSFQPDQIVAFALSQHVPYIDFDVGSLESTRILRATGVMVSHH